MADKVEIDIIANDKATSNVSKVRRAFDGLAGIGKAAGVALLGGATAAAAGFGALIASAVKTNASLETATLQFETLLGSADAAKKHIADLYNFAAKTPFETGPIINASKLLETFGGTALDTMGNLNLIGNAAAVTGQAIDEVGMWFGRAYVAIQSGKPFGEAAMRLQEMGILTAEGRQKIEELQKSGVDTQTVWKALTDEFNRFSGAMEKQAGTMEGLWSTITDSVKLTIGTAFKPFFEVVKSGLGEVVKLVQGPEFAAFADKIAAGLAPLAEKFGEIIKMLVSDMLPAVMNGLVMPFLTFSAQIGPQVIGLLGTLLNAFGQLAGPALGTLTAVLTPLISIFTDLINGALPVLVPLIETIFGAISALLVPVLGEIQNVINMLLPVITNLINSVIPLIMPILQPIIDAMVEIAHIVLPIMADVIAALIEEVTPVIQEIMPALKELFAALALAIVPLIREILPILAEAIIDLTRATMPTIKEVLPPLIRLIADLIIAITPLLITILPPLIKLIVTLATSGLRLVSVALRELTPLIKLIDAGIQTWGRTTQSFSNLLQGTLVPALNAISNAIRGVIDWITDMAARLMDLVLPDWLTPGSPTPFELGLRGISKALDEVVGKAMPELGVSLAGIPNGMGYAMAQAMPSYPAMTGGGYSAPQVVINYQPVFSMADRDELMYKLKPLIEQVLRGK